LGQGSLPPTWANWFVNQALNFHQEEEEGQAGQDWLHRHEGMGAVL